MSYNHANVTLTPGQIKKLKSKHTNATGVSITLKHAQLNGGQIKVSVTQTQLNQISKAKSGGKGVRLDFTSAAIKDMIKSGGIFPFLAAITSLISSAASAVAKASALEAVGTATGMALRKATGKGYKKNGGNIAALAPLLTMAASNHSVMKFPTFYPSFAKMIPDAHGMVAKKISGQGYRKKRGRGLKLPGTPSSWYPKNSSVFTVIQF